MNFYISTFYNVRYLKENQIPISTAVWQPKYWTLHIDKNNVMNGICEEVLSPKFLLESAHVCSKNCSQRPKIPFCEFLTAYSEYLASIDFKALINEFRRVSEEVRKITNFKGESDIILLVYESVNNPCSERAALINLFKNNGIDLKEYIKDKEVI